MFRPFANYLIADVFRAYVIVVGVVSLMLLARVAHHIWRDRANDGSDYNSVSYELGRFAVYLALFAYAISCIFTKVGRFGHIPTWRLPVNVAAVTFSATAAIHMLHFNRK